VGDAGDAPNVVFVDGTDFALARDNPRNFLNRAPIDFPYDYNRDSFVDGFDLAIARDNGTNFLTALKLITVPVMTNQPQPRPVANGLALLDVSDVDRNPVIKEGDEETVAAKRMIAVDFIIGRQLGRKDLPDETLQQRQDGDDSLEDLLTLLAGDWGRSTIDLRTLD
jgi:hypothetical protein